MKYYRIRPSESIAKYVKYFWVGEADVDKDSNFNHFSIATSNAKLVFHYKGHFKELNSSGELKHSFLSGLQGQSKSHTQFISNDPVGIFGIEFFPYAIPSLFSIPATAVTNQFIDIELLPGIRGGDLQDLILAASDNTERVNIATKFLESMMKPFRNPFIIDSIHHMNLSKGEINICNLIGQYQVSQRQFERLFKEMTGFSPKSYAKILRFESAVSKFPGNQSFTEIALDSGYFDQSHFIHDFREFTGFVPKDYWKILKGLPVPVENLQF
jgi:AraC-like DNA-binding protein